MSAVESGSLEPITPDSDSNLEDLLERLVVLLSSGQANLDDICDQYPRHATVLRERLEPLLQFGLLDTISVDERPIRPDARQLGAYHVLGELGHGAMGSVFLGRDPALDRWVAIKVMACPENQLARWLPRFRSEARVLAALQHPHIATVYGMDSKGPRPFIVMELVRGESLQARLEREVRASVPRALEWGRAMVSALDKAHRAGVVHRDLKPGNVVLDPDGVIKVLDFGLAWIAAGSALDTDRFAAGVGFDSGVGIEGVVGTPGYMSPEQQRGESVDGRSDLFSWGAVVFESVSGLPAFGGDTIDERMRRAAEATPDWAELPPMGEDVVALLKSCLSKDPDDRPSQASEVLRRIERALHRIDLVVSPAEGEARTRLGPAYEDAFVGRRAVLPELRERSARARCVTVTGLGGVGKTRLVSEFVQRWLGDLSTNGVWIEADSIEEFSAGEWLDSDVPQKLLVIDGVDGSPARVSQLVISWLAACPGLRVLVTARSRLGIRGEEVLRLGPLPLVDETGDRPWVEQEALELFVERAGLQSGTRLEFSTLGESDQRRLLDLCALVDGHPLAIEILAEQLAHCAMTDLSASAEQELLRLTRRGSEIADPHRSLLDLVESSIPALPLSVLQLWSALSQFGGPWSWDAAHAVCAPEQSRAAFLNDHASLVEASWIDRAGSDTDGTGRYGMLKWVRIAAQAALGRLPGRSEVVARYQSYYLQRTKQISQSGSEGSSGFDVLKSEHRNISGAIESAIESDQWDIATQLIGAVSRYWSVQGHWSEGAQLCERLLSRQQGDPFERSRVLGTLGSLRLQLGDYRAAREALEPALSVQLSQGASLDACRTLNSLSRADMFLGDLDRADSRLEQCFEVQNQLRDRDSEEVLSQQATGLTLLANVAQFRQDSTLAAQRFEECLEFAEANGRDYLIAASLHNLADLDVQSGRPQEAEERYRRAIEINRRLSNQEFLARNLAALGALLRQQLRYDGARASFLEAFELQLTLGDSDAIARLLASLSLFMVEIGAYRLAGLFLSATEQRGKALLEGLPTEAKERIDACRKQVHNELGETDFLRVAERARRSSLSELACALREE